MKRKKAKLKVAFKKAELDDNPKKEKVDDIVELLHEELEEIVRLLDEEFEKPSSTSERPSDNP